MTGRPRRALVTGVTGQDGSYLAEQLLADGYDVVGLTRRPTADDLGAAEFLRDQLTLVQGEITDPVVRAAVIEIAPGEIYHLAAPTFVPDSWADPSATMGAIYGSAATLLHFVTAELPDTRLFLAGSGEMFGDAPQSPQDEDTACRPRSPYASAKLAAHQLAGQLRAHDDVFVVSGILFNHESERRPERFVSRKVTRAVAEIVLGRRERLELGDISAVRDWSFAGDVMHGARLALSHDSPADYVFASGVPHTVEDLVHAAFGHCDLDPSRHVEVDPELVRAPEAVAPVGDPARACEVLGWAPTIDFEQLIGRMVDADLKRLRDG